MSKSNLEKLDFDEFHFRVLAIESENARQRKDQMIAAAFSVWLQGAAPDKSFEHYLRINGLAKDKKPMSAAARKKIADKAYSVMERIMNMDKKKAGK